jgi:hypothetical protein
MNRNMTNKELQEYLIKRSSYKVIKPTENEELKKRKIKNFLLA